MAVERPPRWQGRTLLGKRDQARAQRVGGAFVVVELVDRRRGKTIAVYQQLDGSLRCVCDVWKHNRDCRHVEIVEVARTLAAAWTGELRKHERDQLLRLTPPPGGAKPTRLYED